MNKQDLKARLAGSQGGHNVFYDSVALFVRKSTFVGIDKKRPYCRKFTSIATKFSNGEI